MNDTETPAELTVTNEAITATKSYEGDEFAVPAVVFRFRSERDDEALVRLSDTVPDGVPLDDIGFHPDYGSEYWSIEDDTAVFERRFGPGEEYETVYAIRTTDHGSEGFMTDPTLDVLGLDSDTQTQAPDDAATADSPSTRTDDVSGDGVVDEDAPEETEMANTTDTTDGTDETESRTDDHETTGTTVPSGGVGAALAAELREGDLSEADRELLGEELNVKDATSDVRITHLQSRISDLEAYTDALEEFLEANGSASEFIESTTDQLETIEAEFADVESQTSQNEAQITAIDDRSEKNEGDIDALDKALADIQIDLDEIRESVADLRAEITEINEWRTRIATVLGGGPEDEESS